MEIRQGIDLLKIKRIEKIYKKYEHKFLKKFFSYKEIQQINKSKIEKVDSHQQTQTNIDIEHTLP